MPQEALGIGWIIIFIAIFYFMLIRPQQKQRKARQTMMSNLSVGDDIITIGGFLGTITRIKEDTVWIRLADTVEVENTNIGIGALKNKEELQQEGA